MDNTPSGRGHHKRRKKGARSRFDRRKNDERCQQQDRKENSLTLAGNSTRISIGNPLQPLNLETNCERHHPNCAFENLKPDLLSIPLPDQWKAVSDSNSVEYCQLKGNLNGVHHVAASIVVCADLSWSVYIRGVKVPIACKVLADFPPAIEASSVVSKLVGCVDQAVVCPGNPETQFVAVCQKRGGTMKGLRGSGDTVAYLDEHPVIDSRGQHHTRTIRRVDCDILREPSGQYPLRCRSCQSFRSTLRSSVSRLSTVDHTSASSHASYSRLSPADKDQRLKNLHSSLRLAKQQIRRLEAKVESLIEKEGISLKENDAADISTILREVNSTVDKSFPPDTPQRIFWDQQKAYNSLKEKRQMKWHPVVIRFALNLRYISTSAYRAVRQSGFINLPSERTLSDYTHWTLAHNGVQLEFIEHFKSILEDEVASPQCALSMDEMKIKSGLVFSKRTGSLVGFVDLGSANRDMERLIADDTADSTNGRLADQVFVFMARAVFKPSLAVPIAHYPSLNLSGEKIFPAAWEVIEALELFEIPVVSLVSDGAKPNRRFYNLCQLQDQQAAAGVPYKTINPFRQDSELYFFCDAPHLLKTTRNCFSNSFAHSQSRKLKKGGQYISWKSIESLYLTESATSTPGVRLCHKLTKDHVWLTSYTRMRVNLAAQVMSESVACALEFMDNDCTQQTRVFIRMVDKFFDYLNVKSPKVALLKRKDSIAPYKSPTDERFKWLVDVFLRYLDEWEKEAADHKQLPKKEQRRMCLSRETILGLRITVMSFTELGPQLLKLPNVDYLLSEVFSQDPLERYFSRQRHRGGSNDNPTAEQVPLNAITLIQQQAIYRDLKTMNVEQEVTNLSASQPLKKRPRI